MGDKLEIAQMIKNTVKTYQQSSLLTQEEAFAISGITKKGGMSHGHEFVLKKTHMYPLFKLHKLNKHQIDQKVIPPTRMVTSGVGGPTYRLGTFLDALLKPVVMSYCKSEIVKDSTEFIKELRRLENEGISKNMCLIGTLDVDALYPSIRKDLALEALHDALSTVTKYPPEEIDMILELARICMENSVVHYRGSWYAVLVGIPTGGPESGSIANIVVFYVLEKVLLVHPTVTRNNKLINRLRFLDDLWFGWTGTARQFTLFKTALNKVGGEIGITFKGEVNSSVDFLDVTVTLEADGKINTKLYVKPTDACRYLHRRSDHGQHTFRSTPFSQYRRAVVLCSKDTDRLKGIEYMEKKFLDSGYEREILNVAKRDALALNREEILNTDCSIDTEKKDDEKRTLTFIMNRDNYMSKQIKLILKENQNDIDTLLGGPTRLIVAERRNANTASILFAKSGFSKELLGMGSDQKCGGRGCLTCQTMELPKTVVLWQNDESRRCKVTLDYSCTCKTENVIYLFVCKLCPHNTGFYVGQTVTSCRQRVNRHRDKFNFSEYEKSALSCHIFKDHPDKAHLKLKNFSLGIIKVTSPMNLDRLEDYYVDLTQAELSLNRYKVTT